MSTAQPPTGRPDDDTPARRKPRQRRAFWFLLAAAVLVASTYLIAALQPGPRFSSEDVRIATVASRPIPSFLPRKELDRQIEMFESRVAESPDVLDLRFLAGLYMDRARASGDPTNLARAEAALEQALSQYEGDILAATMLAQVRVSLHDFDGAIELTEAILAADPDRFSALAASGDALLSVGDYDNARSRFEPIIAVAPDDPGVLIRRSELAWIEGDHTTAVELAELAASSIPEFRTREAAFFAATAAQTTFEAGMLDRAFDHAEQAFGLDPESPAVAATLARVVAANGDRQRAIELYEQAVESIPNPDYLAELGDLYLLEGRDTEADDTYDTVEVIAELTPDIYGRQLAVFFADHDIQPERALEITTVALEQRTDVDGYDAHAWALYRNERFEEAREASDRALAMGTRSAPFLYHAGLISAALGDTERAIRELEDALNINPRWSPLQAEQAHAALKDLESS